MSFAHEVQRKPSLRAGVEKMVSRRLCDEQHRTLTVTSTDFVSGGELPRSASKDGEGMPPAIAWANAPEGTQSFVVICEDPDAPLPEPFAHWLVYGIAGGATMVDSKSRNGNGVREGKNSNLRVGFAPVAPPHRHGVHHYHFQVFALNTALALGPGVGRYQLAETIRHHILAWGETIGTYESE